MDRAQLRKLVEEFHEEFGEVERDDKVVCRAGSLPDGVCDFGDVPVFLAGGSTSAMCGSQEHAQAQYRGYKAGEEALLIDYIIIGPEHYDAPWFVDRLGETLLDFPAEFKGVKVYYRESGGGRALHGAGG